MANLATISNNILADSGIDPIDLIVGTGTVNYVPKFTAEGTIANSQIFDNGTTVAIGTTATNGSRLQVQGNTDIWHSVNTLLRLYHDGTRAVLQSYTAGAYSNIALNPDAGNVGIGTDTPTQKLVVIGNTAISGVTYTDYIQTYTGASIDFRHQDASVIMRIDTANARVGIGTTSPLGPLDVRSTGLAQIYFGYPNAGEYGYLGRDANSGLYSLNIVQNANLAIWTNNTERMRITAAGNVGIGTSSPAGQLDVYTSVYQRLTVIYPGTYVTKLTIGGNSFIQQDAENELLTIDQGYGSGDIAFNAGGSVERMRIWENGSIKFNNYGSGSKTGTPTYNLAVDASGNIIETAGGVVDGSGTANYVTKWIDANTIGNSQIFDNGTNVGIGTPSPAYKLDVLGSFSFTTGGNYLQYSSGILYHGNYYQFPSGNNYLLFARASGDLVFGANDTERMRITSAGNVGIGTSSPGAKLDVRGRTNIFGAGTTAATLGLSVLDSTGSNYNFYVEDNGGAYLRGNVRIGNSTDNGYKLDVDGSVRFVGNTYVGGIINAYQGDASIWVLNVGQAFTIKANTGEVLIGTTVDSGEYKLQVNGRGLFQERVVVNDGPNDAQLQILGNGTNIMSLQGRDVSGSGTSLVAINNDGGNVSIGTTASLSRLTILSDSSAQTLSLIGRAADGIATIRWWNNAGNAVYTAIESNATYTIYNTVTNGYAAFFTNNTERMRITAAGNVGIGTSSPMRALNIVSNNAQIRISDSTAPSTNYWEFSSVFFNTNQDLFISNQSVTALTINSVGNVGIGTTNPTVKLQVENNSHNYIQVNSSVANVQTAINVTNSASTSRASLSWEDGTRGAYADLYSSTYLTLTTQSSEKMRITAAGNVGIGTSSPVSPLDVNGILSSRGIFIAQNSGTYNLIYNASNSIAMYIGGTADPATYYDNLYHYFRSTAGTTTYGVWNSTGLGVGTSSPSTKLHVVGYVRTDGGMIVNGSDANYREIIFTTSSASRWNLYTYGAEGGANSGSVLYLARYADNGDYIANVATFLRTNGYVGIATSTPTQQLHVSGNIRVTGAYYDSNNSSGTSGQVLSSTATGTDWVSLSEITGVDGTGTANYVPKWLDANTIGNSVIYENGGNIGIGVTDADYPLTVGSINVGGAGANLGIIINSVINTAIPSSSVKALIGVTNSGFGYSAGSLLIQPRTGVSGVIAFATEGSEKMRISSDGNVGIGTTYTDGLISGTEKVLKVSNSNIASIYLESAGNGIWANYINSARSLVWYDITADAERMRINSSGQLLVGTSSGYGSNGKVVVQNGTIVGASSNWNNSTTGNAIEVFGDNNSNGGTIWASANGNQAWGNISISPLGGNVGIGIYVPAAKLHVVETSNSATTYPLIINNQNNQAGDGWGAGIKFSTSNPLGGGNEGLKWSSIQAFDVNNYGSSSGLSFTVSETYNKNTAMVINRYGAVGIGTTTPFQKFQVVGNGMFGDNKSSGSGVLTVSLVGGVSDTRDIGYVFSGAANREIGSKISFIGSGNLSSYQGGYMTFSTSVAGDTNLNERMRITDSGNVLINTTTSTNSNYYLQVVQGISSSTSVLAQGTLTGYSGAGVFMSYESYGGRLEAYDYSTTSWKNIAIAPNGGDVGIGNTAPQRKLHVAGNFAVNASGSQYYGVYIPANGEGASPTILIGDWWNASGNLTWDSSNKIFNINSLYGSNAAPITFSGNSAERMRITAAGNVSIGNTNDTYKLDVTGAARFTGQVNSETLFYVVAAPPAINGGLITVRDTVTATNVTSFAGVFFNSTPGNDYSIGKLTENGTGYLQIRNANSGAELLRMTASGVTTFSSSVTSTGLIVNGQEFYYAPANYASGGFARLLGRNSSTGRIEGMSAADVQAFIGLSGYISGSGTTNYLPKFTSASAIGNSLLYDDGTTVSIGLGATTPSYTSAYGYPQFAIESNAFASSHVFTHNSTNGNYSFFALGKSKGTAAAPTIVENSETIGDIQFWAYDGAAYRNTAFIRNQIDGEPGAGDTPGRLVFATTTDGSSAASEKMRITSGGNVLIGTTSDVGSKLYVEGGIRASGAVVSGGILEFTGAWSASPYNGSSWVRAANGVGIFLVNNAITRWVGFKPNNDFVVNSDNLLVQSSTGYVGVGTDAPAYKFVVNESSTNPIAYFGTAPLNASSRNALIILQSGTIPQYGSDTTGEAGFLFKHSYGTGGVNGTANGGYIESIRESTFGITSQVNTALVFGTSSANIDGERMRITSTGNVGIGTSAPSYKLEVVGAIRATGTLYSDNGSLAGTLNLGQIVSVGSSFGSYANLVFTMHNGGGFSDIMKLQGNGNVGIGTNSPAYKLDVNGDARFIFRNSSNEIMDLLLSTEVAASKSKLSLLWYGNETASLKFTRGANSTGGSLEFWTQQEFGSIEQRMTVASSGNVGINTTAPAYKLHVEGSVGINGITIPITNNTYALGGGSNKWSQIWGARYFADDGSAGAPSYSFAGDQDTGFWKPGDGVLATSVNGVERMRIDGSGNVSINTTASYGKLNITGYDNGGINIIDQRTSSGGLFYSSITFRDYYLDRSASIDFYHNQYFGSGVNRLSFSFLGSERMSILYNGNVGIGTSSPTAALQIANSSRALAVYRIQGTNRTTFYDNDFAINNDGGGADGFIYGSNVGGSFPFNGYGEVIMQANPRTGYSNGISFVTGTTAPTIKMRIVEGGNVGIGTDSPSDELTVNSAGNSTGIAIQRSGVTKGLLEIGSSSDTFAISATSATGILTFATNSSERMRITDGGNVGINTSTPIARLHVQESSNARALIQVVGGEVAGDNAGLYFKSAVNYSDAYMKGGVFFSNNGTGHGRGNLIFATNNTANGDNVSIADAKLTITAAGAATFTSSVTATGFFESSDARLKVVVDEDYRHNAIANIKPKFYEKNGKFEAGYIAQDVQKIYEHAVSLGTDGYLSLSYGQIHTLKIAYLEDTVEEIKRKIAYLEQQLNNK